LRDVRASTTCTSTSSAASSSRGHPDADRSATTM
jgi:hypothetical protein